MGFRLPTPLLDTSSFAVSVLDLFRLTKATASGKNRRAAERQSREIENLCPDSPVMRVLPSSALRLWRRMLTILEFFKHPSEYYEHYHPKHLRTGNS